MTPQYQVFTFVAGNVSVPATTETVVGTSLKAKSSYPGCTFGIRFGVDFTPGTGQTSVVAKIERGTAAGGTAVYTSQALTTIAATPIRWSFECTDSFAGDVDNQQYVLTLTAQAGAGTGTAANVSSCIIVAE